MAKFYTKKTIFQKLLKEYKDIFKAPEDSVIIAYNFEGEVGYNTSLNAQNATLEKTLVV